MWINADPSSSILHSIFLENGLLRIIDNETKIGLVHEDSWADVISDLLYIDVAPSMREAQIGVNDSIMELGRKAFMKFMDEFSAKYQEY